MFERLVSIHLTAYLIWVYSNTLLLEVVLLKFNHPQIHLEGVLVFNTGHTELSFTEVNIILSTVVHFDSSVHRIVKSTFDHNLTIVQGNNFNFFHAASVESVSIYILKVIVSSVQVISK
jgi:hypothetical protein